MANFKPNQIKKERLTLLWRFCHLKLF